MVWRRTTKRREEGRVGRPRDRRGSRPVQAQLRRRRFGTRADGDVDVDDVVVVVADDDGDRRSSACDGMDAWPWQWRASTWRGIRSVSGFAGRKAAAGGTQKEATGVSTKR